MTCLQFLEKVCFHGMTSALGAMPYSGMSAMEVMRQVLSGLRLQRPLHCKEEMYVLQIITIQSNPVISNSLISNYRLSRSKNLVPVLT